LLLGATAATSLPAQSVDSLLYADRELSTLGFIGAVDHAAADVVLVYPGAPLISGHDAALQMLRSQSVLRALSVRWVPLFGAVSGDGAFGVTYGVTSIVDSTRASGTLRFGKYLSAWRHDADGWRLVAHAQLGLVAGSAFVAPSGFDPGTPLPGSGATPFAAADAAFAAQAGRDGAAAAFAAWIAADGVMFPSTGELARAPAGARAVLGRGSSSSWWSWAPLAGMGARSGDLGFTAGEATITAPGGAAAYSKYLTLWRRDPDGHVRFIADGGSARPGPAVR
jgi:ketosteroid isomerase-like protein